jgi:hypothetical protein
MSRMEPYRDHPTIEAKEVNVSSLGRRRMVIGGGEGATKGEGGKVKDDEVKISCFSKNVMGVDIEKYPIKV